MFKYQLGKSVVTVFVKHFLASLDIFVGFAEHFIGVFLELTLIFFRYLLAAAFFGAFAMPFSSAFHDDNDKYYQSYYS